MSPLLRRVAIAACGLAAAGLVGVTDILGGYGQFIVGSVAFTAIAVLAVSLLAGLTGIWSLGHMAFVALGAYLAADLAAAGVPLEGIVPAAVLASGLIGFVLGLSAGRFSVLYFGLLTMALSLAASEVIGHWTEATGGDEGMTVVPVRVALLGTTLDLRGAVVLSILLAAAAFLVADLAATGSAGRRWRAVKSQRVAAAAIGLRPQRENAAAFALSAALSSLSGIAVAFSIGYLDPVGFDLNAGVRLIVATVVGGAGSLPGSLLGAAFIVVMPEIARGLPTVAAFVFGLATVVTLLFLRRGIVPSLAFWLRRRTQGPASSRPSARPFDAGAVASLARDLLAPAPDTLVVRGLSVRFGGVRALDGVGLDVRPGETVGLIGPNGAGKTTFLNVLSGFYAASEAQAVRLGGADLLRLDPSGRSTVGFGRTFQHAELFADLSLRQMLELAAEQGASRRSAAGLSGAPPAAVAGRILDGLGLAEVAALRPEELPFGIQKVADVARAVATSPSLLAMDEPFAGLDAQERTAIRTILAGMREAGVSVLIIDHAVQEIMGACDRVVVFEFGRLLAEGTPDVVRADPEVLRAYFGTAEIGADRMAAPA